MKSSYYKLILGFYIIGLILIWGISFAIFKLEPAYPGTIWKITMLATLLLALACIAMGIYTHKKILVPISRMLKSPSKLEPETDIKVSSDDLGEVVTELQLKLKDANNEKLQKDTILKHMTDGIISFDMDGYVTYINPAAMTMLELTDKDDRFEKIFSKYDNKDINMEKMIYLENWTSTERKIENNQGSMNLFFIPFKDEINRPTGVLVVVQDITEHVKLDNMRKEFIADVSHELKTPLTSILGYSETILDGGVDDVETEKLFTQKIYDAGERMQKLVQDLLELSRYDTSNRPVNVKEFDLVELCKNCVDNFEYARSQKKQDLECIVTANIPKVKANEDDIGKVVSNIISNAIKYTTEQGKIYVYVGYVHNYAYVKVKDNGIGIPKEDLDKIFDRFYRVDKARARDMGGTGLGLAIAKEIIERNGGSISVESEYMKGSEFTIRIPVGK